MINKIRQIQNEENNKNNNGIDDLTTVLSVKEKRPWKKILGLLLAIFLLIHVGLYVGFYNNYVSNAPEKLKEGRKDLIIAHMITMYEVVLVKLGISFTNPVLKAFQIPKEYFYHKGIDKLPKDDADRVYWYQMTIFYPIVYELRTSGYKTGNVTHNYGKEFTEKLLNDISSNIEILSKYKLSDYENNEYLQKKLLYLTYEMFNIYVYNYHLFDDASFYGRKAVSEAQNDVKINKLISVYQSMQNIFNKPYYQEDFKKYILSNKDYYLDYYEALFDATTVLLYNRISHQKLNCNDKFDKQIMNDFISFEQKIRQLLKKQKYKQSKIEFLNIRLNKQVVIQQEKKQIQMCMKEEKGE